MRQITSVVMVIAVGLITVPSISAAPEFGVNLYGVSYHLDRTDTEGNSFHEQNLGLGFRAIVRNSKKGVTFFEAGWFEDSYDHGARYLSVAYQVKITQGILLGINLGYYEAPTVDGRLIAPVPTLTLRYHVIALNIIHIPGFSGINPYPSFGGYLTLYVLRG